jgi:hypothetical protein
VDLQAKLGKLDAFESFELSDEDYERLFGTDEANAARLGNFARGHQCYLVPSRGRTVIFRKLSVRRPASGPASVT